MLLAAVPLDPTARSAVRPHHTFAKQPSPSTAPLAHRQPVARAHVAQVAFGALLPWEEDVVDMGPHVDRIESVVVRFERVRRRSQWWRLYQADVQRVRLAVRSQSEGDVVVLGVCVPWLAIRITVLREEHPP